jgi:cellulose synthase/poly-beta-1,6-N-acetylglucosamine synthase-like glycosyltransferase
MAFLDYIIPVYSILFCLLWCVLSIQRIYLTLRISLFEKEDPPTPLKWPKLSVVIAARNEAETIEKAVSTLLEQDYPDIEIILVNDRSTDQTGKIIDDIARKDVRVKSVHVKYLPHGWLGKVYALNIGTQKTVGDWILYTDADVHFRQGTIRKAIALAISKQSHHLTLVPKPDTPSFLLEIVIQAFGALFIQGTKASEVDKPGSNAFVGTGAFNLVKKSALEKTEGFSWLRMEVADDVGLGLMLHKSGAKSHFSVSIHDISLIWYPSIKRMFNGLEKNLFGVSSRYSFTRMTFIFVFFWLLFLSPSIAIVYRKVPYLWIFGVIPLLFVVIEALISKLKLKQRFISLLSIPLGHLIISLMLLHSGIMCKLHGGIIWRGTKYSINDLRTGQRVKL